MTTTALKASYLVGHRLSSARRLPTWMEYPDKT
jgi:hypothetical protein